MALCPVILKSTRFTHSVSLLHFSTQHPQKHSARRHQPLMSLMGCYAPVPLCSSSVCRAVVGVNVPSVSILSYCWHAPLNCCSDLYFVFPLSMYLTALTLFFMSQCLNNELFHIAVILKSFHWKVLLCISVLMCSIKAAKEKIFTFSRLSHSTERKEVLSYP